MATNSSCLASKNPMDRGTWWATVHGVAKSQTKLHARLAEPTEDTLNTICACMSSACFRPE